ncbi:MAG TPA: CBS domain-containing protein [Methylomirabilota bacterium]|nr:CBS domain-containing protein [Methylomirabilota bacterium]
MSRRADQGQVRDWMTRAPVTVTPETSVGDTARLMRSREIRHVLVTEGEQVVGIVSDRDLRGLPQEAQPGPPPGAPVARVMSEPPLIVEPDTSVTVAARALLDSRIGALPVVDAGRATGIFTTADALEALLAWIEAREP